MKRQTWYLSLIALGCCLAGQVSAFSAISPSSQTQTSFSESDPISNPLRNGVSETLQTNSTAIILNTNARSVNENVIPIAESIFGKDYVYVTTTEEEGKEAAAQLVRQNISMVLPVGGDGTLSSMINFMCSSIREENPSLSVEETMKKLPLIGYVPLGTGNGVGSVVGPDMISLPAWKIFRRKAQRRKQLTDIMQRFYDIGQELNKNPEYLTQDEDVDVVELPLMEISYPDSKVHDDTLCFFAGAGFDSLMLQDFQRIKKWAIRTKFLTKTLSSVAGYCVALVLKTLPKCVARQEHNIEVKLSTRDPDALWVDHRRGDVVQKVGPTADTSANEAVLYKGVTGILAASTTPFYGGGLRLFPFARMTTDKMHLRLGRIHPVRGFFNIPKIFEGSFRDKGSASFGCMDYIASDFDVLVTSSGTDVNRERMKGFPVQHSGESAGFFERFRLRVLEEPVRFVTLMRKRVVDETRENTQ